MVNAAALDEFSYLGDMINRGAEESVIMMEKA
mgnify:CR=1 FL=1